jgi:hypothetical protein
MSHKKISHRNKSQTWVTEKSERSHIWVTEVCHRSSVTWKCHRKPQWVT